MNNQEKSIIPNSIEAEKMVKDIFKLVRMLKPKPNQLDNREYKLLNKITIKLVHPNV